jgi:hypothetical protein
MIFHMFIYEQSNSLHPSFCVATRVLKENDYDHYILTQEVLDLDFGIIMIR